MKGEATENASSDRVITWNDNDTSFDLQFEKFCVNANVLATTLIPKRLFCCWVEECEQSFLEKNNIIPMTHLLEKYKDLVFLCPDNNILYTAANKMLLLPPGKKDGWAVLGIPEGDRGTDEDNVVTFILRENIAGEMIKDTEHPQEDHIELVREHSIECDEVSSSDEESDEQT